MKALGVACMITSVGLLFGCASTGTGSEQVQEPVTMTIVGAVAYSDIIKFDYNGDGQRNPLRFWLGFDGRSATGTPGSEDFQPASGQMYYFLVNEDDPTVPLRWRQGLDMVGGAPRDKPFPMFNLEFEGQTARFTAFGVDWTITDSGEGYENVTVIADDGFKAAQVRLYAGGIRIGPAE